MDKSLRSRKRRAAERRLGNELLRLGSHPSAEGTRLVPRVIDLRSLSADGLRREAMTFEECDGESDCRIKADQESVSHR